MGRYGLLRIDCGISYGRRVCIYISCHLGDDTCAHERIIFGERERHHGALTGMPQSDLGITRRKADDPPLPLPAVVLFAGRASDDRNDRTGDMTLATTVPKLRQLIV